MNFAPRATFHESRRKVFLLAFVLFVAWFVVRGSWFAFAGEPLYTLSAKVSEAQPNDSTFLAHFKHPATGENLEYLFQVTEHTGMNGLKHVKELKRDDLLQIDYFKKADGSLIVEYMARVKMEGAPDGLDQFNPADLLRSAQQKK